MKKMAFALTCVALMASAQAAVELSYSTSGNNTIVTAADGGTTYWEMTIDTASNTPGRIMAFYDKSGASSDIYNYAHPYSTDAGLLDPMDDGRLDEPYKWTISNIVMGTTEMTYTLSRELTKDTGTATYSMDFTIGLPAITASGYDTNVHVVDTLFYDANWVGAAYEAQIRTETSLRVTAADEGYTFNTHNGIAEGGAANLSVEATVTDANPDMAAGSTFTTTFTYDLYDDAFDEATASYDEHGGDFAFLFTRLGVTGEWKGNPGPAGSDRMFTSAVDLDISIVSAPEPATMMIVAAGIPILLKHRRRRG